MITISFPDERLQLFYRTRSEKINKAGTQIIRFGKYMERKITGRSFYKRPAFCIAASQFPPAA